MEQAGLWSADLPAGAGMQCQVPVAYLAPASGLLQSSQHVWLAATDTLLQAHMLNEIVYCPSREYAEPGVYFV